jgi:inorganic pyrophosphatase
MADRRSKDELEKLLAMRFAAHPWHGVSIGEKAPEEVAVFVEIVPTDSIKYELDKVSGHLKIDRPQRYSSFSPTLYGFIPQTYCGDSVAALCVLSERDVSHSGVLLRARPIGGLRMIDGNQADDKIIAVLAGDAAYDEVPDVAKLPHGMLDRMRHYFLTYKQMPGEQRKVEIREVYDRTEALEMIRRSQADYAGKFGDPEQRERHLISLLR